MGVQKQTSTGPDESNLGIFPVSDFAYLKIEVMYLYCSLQIQEKTLLPNSALAPCHVSLSCSRDNTFRKLQKDKVEVRGVGGKMIEAFKPFLILICTDGMLTGNLSASQMRQLNFISAKQLSSGLSVVRKTLSTFAVLLLRIVSNAACEMSYC